MAVACVPPAGGAPIVTTGTAEYPAEVLVTVMLLTDVPVRLAVAVAAGGAVIVTVGAVV